jgi:RHS repeat-associated protein
MLVRTRVGERVIDGRYPDELGRIFETEARIDRAYGAAGELQWRRDAQGTTRYTHDAAGRLATRVDPDGGTWRYWWNDAGRLVQVDRPDGVAVAFGYDALGRRIAKSSSGVRTCFAWDGQQTLHEWEEKADVVQVRALPGEDARQKALVELLAELSRVLPAEQVAARRDEVLTRTAKRHPGVVARVRAAAGEVAATRDAVGGVITWLFAPGGHAPIARLGRGEACSIVADQVGAPLVVLDSRGEVKAQLVLDSRGRAEVAGDGSVCPWRFAGQYRDDETGLHYNRFRYYDADAGQYISRDPLGLRAGLRVYGYVGDPGVASDPLGLIKQPGAGCAASASATDADTKAHRHHADPKFMGGDPKQSLTELGEDVHKELHRDLNDFLHTQTDELGNHMRPQRGNPGSTIRSNFSRDERLSALSEFYRENQEKYPQAAEDFFKQHPELT